MPPAVGALCFASTRLRLNQRLSTMFPMLHSCSVLWLYGLVSGLHLCVCVFVYERRSWQPATVSFVPSLPCIRGFSNETRWPCTNGCCVCVCLSVLVCVYLSTTMASTRKIYVTLVRANDKRRKRNTSATLLLLFINPYTNTHPFASLVSLLFVYKMHQFWRDWLCVAFRVTDSHYIYVYIYIYYWQTSDNGNRIILNAFLYSIRFECVGVGDHYYWAGMRYDGRMDGWISICMWCEIHIYTQYIAHILMHVVPAPRA